MAADTFDRYVNRNPTCWLWTGGLDRYGYGKYGAGAERAHRVAWERANGPVPEGLHVLHKCDVRICVNPEHLFLGTNTDNVHDKMRKRRWRPHSVPDETIEAIRAAAGRVGEVAARFGVNRHLVYRIRRKTSRVLASPRG